MKIVLACCLSEFVVSDWGRDCTLSQYDCSRTSGLQEDCSGCCCWCPQRPHSPIGSDSSFGAARWFADLCAKRPPRHCCWHCCSSTCDVDAAAAAIEVDTGNRRVFGPHPRFHHRLARFHSASPLLRNLRSIRPSSFCALSNVFSRLCEAPFDCPHSARQRKLNG